MKIHLKTKYTEEQVQVVFRHYNNGRHAISFYGIDFPELISTATVNIPEVDLEEDEVIIKDWAENEGMVESLVENGIIEVTGRTVRGGYVEAPICRLLVDPEEIK